MLPNQAIDQNRQFQMTALLHPSQAATQNLLSQAHSQAPLVQEIDRNHQARATTQHLLAQATTQHHPAQETTQNQPAQEITRNQPAQMNFHVHQL